ncbi:MAG: hypothetical protein AB7P03_03440 [Kofleriaceae bacterium]
MKARTIARVVRKGRLGEIDEDAERRAYWGSMSVAARIAEVESLRRLWIGLTGDPDLPIVRVVHRRKLGDPGQRSPT